MIRHFPSASLRQMDVKMDVCLPEGSNTGPELMARVPESRTSTVSGFQENGASLPS